MRVYTETVKRVVVTGGTRGIGYAIADLFTKEGHEVTVTGTHQEAKNPTGCGYITVDFLDGINNFLQYLRQYPVDVLINNAGINKISPFSDIEFGDFLKIQQVNMTTPFQLCQAVIPGMVRRKWGRIVNIGSIWSLIGKTQRASYSASKFALDGITVALSAEVAQHNVLVNCVSPGFIDTELTRSVLSEEQIGELVAQVPAQRLGTPEEIAKFVVWLASEENTFISGQNIAIDGGFTRV